MAANSMADSSLRFLNVLPFSVLSTFYNKEPVIYLSSFFDSFSFLFGLKMSALLPDTSPYLGQAFYCDNRRNLADMSHHRRRLCCVTGMMSIQTLMEKIDIVW